MKSINKLGSIDNAGKISLNSDEFGKGMMDYKKSSAHRKDMKRASRMDVIDGKKIIYIKYANSIGLPDIEEMTNYVVANYHGFKPLFENADHDEKNHVVAIEIVKDEPRIAVKDIESIPAGFKPIGSGLYKDASENQIWTLKKSDDGSLNLTRSAEEKPILEEAPTDVFKVAKQFKKGDEVSLRSGERGTIISFDKVGNSVVKIEGEDKLRIVSSNLLFQEKAQQDIRNEAENDMGDLYKELITLEHKPDKDEADFYKDLISDPTV